MWNEFWFGVFPFLALGLFFGVPLWRAYKGKLQWTARGDFAWTPRASGFFETRWMATASWALHLGIFLLFISHLLGLLGGHYNRTNLVDMFHWLGMAGGVLFVYGLALALVRRLTIPEMRVMSKTEDYVILVLLISIAVLALIRVVALNRFGDTPSVAAWLVSLFKFSPQVALMSGNSMSLITQIHVSLAMLFFAYFPFTKMVHVWSFPFEYLARPYISVRKYLRWAR